MIQGKLFIISAPSGTGKTSIIKYFLNTKLPFKNKISISYTTRNKRPGELNGVHYYFISKEKFKKMIKKNFFLEYAVIFNNYYGTSKDQIKKYLLKGMNIFLDIDWQGTVKIKKKIKNVVTIFMLPPSKQELLIRLKKRKQDNKKIIYKRMKIKIKDIENYKKYDYLIINNKFNKSLKKLKYIFLAEQLRINNQNKNYNKIIDKLLKK